MLDFLRWGCVLSAAASVTITVGMLTTVTPIERARYGYRGAARQRALDAGGLFAVAEPTVRFVAALVGALPLATLRARQIRELQRADDVLGLQPDELSALSLLSTAVLGAAVSALVRAMHAPEWIVPVAVAFGLYLPTLQVRELSRNRAKAITRALPPAIEIAAMCMGAGLDFPGSLRMLTEKNHPNPTPLGREFAVILEHLDFGHTRKLALESFAERVPSRAVREFVHAVIQSEQKGNPLARVLQIQGRMLNMRRSVLAEEAAARAGVLLIIPMVLLLAAILLLLMGPFIVKGIGW
jgi:tight adherence protein C